MLFKKASLLDKIIALLSESCNGSDFKTVLKKLQQDKRITLNEGSSLLTIKLPFYAPFWVAELQQRNSKKIEKLLGKNIELALRK